MLRLWKDTAALDAQVAKVQRRVRRKEERWDRLGLGAKARWSEQCALGRVFVAGMVARGEVRVSAQWVRLLVAMEPGRWYGEALLGRMVGRKKPIGHGAQHQLRAMLDKADNPAWREIHLSAVVLGAMAKRGEHIEPRHLWRLSQWAVELRAAVLDDPTCETVDVLALPSAPENLKSRGGRLFQPNHRG